MSKDINLIPTEFDVDVGLDNVDVDLSGSLGLGLDDINMEIDMGLEDVNIDMGLDDVNIDMGLDDINIDMGLDNVKVDLGLDDINVCLSMGIKELPSMKLHLPMNYEMGYELFGFKVFNLCFGGKSMMVTEPNPTQLFYHGKQRTGSTDSGEVSVRLVETEEKE